MRRFVSAWGVWIIGVIGLLIALVSPSWLDSQRAGSAVPTIIAWPSCLIGMLVASIILHESAHALACLLLRMRVIWICIGRGKQIAEFHLSGIRVVLMSASVFLHFAFPNLY